MLPTTNVGLYQWVLGIMIIYVVLAMLFAHIKNPKHPIKNRKNESVNQVFNGVTMAVSSLLLVGFVEPNLMELLGDKKLFLLIGGFAGVCYSGWSLFDGD